MERAGGGGCGGGESSKPERKCNCRKLNHFGRNRIYTDEEIFIVLKRINNDFFVKSCCSQILSTVVLN
jgi:hypothetical protein